MSCPKNASATRANTDFLYYTERDDIRKQLFAVSLPFCVWCQEEVGDWRSKRPFTADHVVCRQQGGAYTLDNLALSCGPCNSDRGSLSVLAYSLKLAHRRDAMAQIADMSLAA